jgi:hypothetical protein
MGVRDSSLRDKGLEHMEPWLSRLREPSGGTRIMGNSELFSTSGQRAH